MGGHSLVQPVTTEEVRSMMASFNTDISYLRSQMVHVNETLQDLIGIISAEAPLSGTTVNSANPSKETRTRAPTIKIPPLAALSTTDKHNTAATAIVHLSPWQACNSPSMSNSNDSETVTMPSTLVAHSGWHTSQSHAGPENASTSTAGSGHIGHQRTSSSRSLPTAGLFIPDVPVRNPDGSRRPKSESWRDIVKHWTEGDPALGLHTPLRDWPPEWTQGNNRLFAAKYHQRSVVALEFLNT